MNGTLRICAEHASKVQSKKRACKTVMFGNHPGTLTRIMHRYHITIFKQRHSCRLTGYKIG